MSEIRNERRNPAPQPIKNKDIPLLSSIFCVMQEIKSLERRREWQHDRMFVITKKLTGMPSGSGTQRGLDAAFAAIDDLDEQHGEQIKQYARDLKKAERILNSIPSRKMRTFVQMYYIDEIGKGEIMRELNMTEWGFDRARTAIEQAPDMAHVVWRERFIIENKA
ncbi:MAG: DUF1492 domain-containing protein [Succinivibrionaceae bacterium]|nr:DUF1492 domain-containing protein [Succinivibrionaceae bacterium]